MEINETEVPEDDVSEHAIATQLLDEIAQTASGIKEKFDVPIKELAAKYQPEKGLSFLDMKLHLCLDYLINLTYIALKKVSGKRIEGDPAIERLVEISKVLTKTKPIAKAIQHRVNRLLDVAASGSVDQNDPLNFRPNPANMILSDADGEDGSDEKEEKTKSNVYVPPKITAMHYDGDETLEQRKQKALAKVQKRALSSSIMHELKRQYDDGPEEIRETSDLHKIRVNNEMKNRVRFEEEYMMRLPVSKRQKQNSGQFATMSDLSSITKFGNISALEMGVDDVPLKKKTSKMASMKKGKRKSFRNHRHHH